jgi:predicted nucleic acid-binding protein
VAEADFLAVLARQEFELVPLTASDFSRAAELTRKYSDWPLGAVDASVIAVAERFGDSDVATTDRRHFYAVAEARSFTLHPAV